VQRALGASLFQSGARYLGDDETMCAAPAPGVPRAPPPAWVELAVMGRSNAGKSTLLNALLGGRAADGARAFVPVSRRPGSTVRLDFYGVGAGARPSLVLVDSPGYGFSSRGKAAHGAWMARTSAYLRSRRALAGAGDSVLARVMVLADARVGLTPLDADVLAMLDEQALPAHVVLTKTDTLRVGELDTVATRTVAALSKLVMPFPVLNAVSARTGAGMATLQHTLMQTSKVHRLDARSASAHLEQLAALRAAQQ
jgi:GTP-binding protein